MRPILGAFVAAGLMVGGAPALARQAAPTPGALFADHAVLQRDRPISIWGRADPGAGVVVSLADRTVRATADAEGRWNAMLPALPAGGPHDLTLESGGRTTVRRDILIGDVFLCSGQSNMALPLSRALNAPGEIAGSADDEIRLLTVPLKNLPTPQAEFSTPLSWAAAGPETVADFSAACYFFARDLRRDHDVPMGLIADAWGGSTIQAWMSAPALEAVGDYDASLAILSQYAAGRPEAQSAWGAQWEAWWREHGQGEPWREPTSASGWTAVPAMTPWEQWGEPELSEFNGMVWYRTDITLSAEQASQSAVLSLGGVDEADQTWVNGVPVGASGSGDRTYPLPDGLLKPGVNTVTVNVLDTYGVGGLYGPAEKRVLKLADGSAVPLDVGGWRYRQVAGDLGAQPRAPWEALAGLTTIHNAMIAPMRDYGLKGVLWYQGESNAGRNPEGYDRLLTGLMADWRRQFDNLDLPFLIVSLANYGAPSSTPGPSGWAELRDRVRTAVAGDDHAALAVAVDLGDRWDIHPAQKLELGRRLARAARAVVYGETIAPSGPEVVEARRAGDEVVVTFRNVENGLRAYSGGRALGFELCAADGTACRYAEAHAESDVVRLTVPAGAAAGQVRYAWADNPVINLFDGAGLPAGPFRLDVQ